MKSNPKFKHPNRLLKTLTSLSLLVS